jgi:hypothetical protein
MQHARIGHQVNNTKISAVVRREHRDNGEDLVRGPSIEITGLAEAAAVIKEEADLGKGSIY